jgi:enoyl-CoA hydratase/carnithine racemase
MTDPIRYGCDDGVAVVTLNRPDRLNAWSPEMTVGYLAALDRATADPEARVVVVTGAGRGFCAGADMSLLQGLSDGGPRVAVADRPPFQMEPAVPKPVIAAINGACAGLGLVRALYCDLRVAVRGAKITTAFARRGLVAEYGISWLLPRIVGLPHALDLLMSGRTLLAEEAVEIGLIDRLVDSDALGAATDYAGELARLSSPASMRDMKRQVWGDLTGPLEESVERAEALMSASFSRPDLAEGVASYLEHRDPRFLPLP